MIQNGLPIEDADTLDDARLPRAHRHTLVEMNQPVFMARRDAAHACAVDILKYDLVANSKECREELYQRCLDLLDEAQHTNSRSQVQQNTAVTHYLELLRNTVGACHALVKYEIMLVRETEEFSQLLGSASISSLQSTNDVFSASEMNIIDCIDSLTQLGLPLIKQDTDERTQGFHDSEKKRYKIARSEYSRLYARSKDLGDSGMLA
jgi:hypothetical protein